MSKCNFNMQSEAFTTTLRLPEGCRREDCDYFVGIGPEEKDHNLLHFVLEGKAKGWVAIGFSPTPNMVGISSNHSPRRHFPN